MTNHIDEKDDFSRETPAPGLPSSELEHLDFLRDLDFSCLDADFADVRIVSRRNSTIVYRNDDLHTANSVDDVGAFARVLKNGSWAYGSTNDPREARGLLESLAMLASKLPPESDRSRSAAMAETFNTAPENIVSAGLPGPDPTTTPLETRRSLLKKFNDTAAACQSIISRRCVYNDWWERRSYASSSGALSSYEKAVAGVALSYTMKRGGSIYSSYFMTGGPSLDELETNLSRLPANLEEATRFLDAIPVPMGDYPVVLSPKASGVFSHESFGHKSEADFMLGDRTMREEWKIGMKVGSELLSIVDDPTFRLSPGFCPFDDEGTRGRKTYLVKDGVLAGRLHSRATALELGEVPRGNARGLGYSFEPIVRMTTTYIEPGEGNLEDLLKGIELGVYIKTVKHGSGMSTFTIAPDRSYMIRDGRLAEPVRVSVVSGSVFETLSLIEGISGELEIDNDPFCSCGKGEQFPMPAGIGGPSVRVGSMRVS